MTFLDALPGLRQVSYLTVSTLSSTATFVLAVLAACIVVAVVVTVRGLWRGHRGTSTGVPLGVGERVGVLLVVVAACVLTGVALLTPPTTLPGPRPASDATWLFLPAAPTYIALAVLAHALAAIVGIILILLPAVSALAIDTHAGYPVERSRVRTLLVMIPATAVVMAFLIITWELAGWPSWFLLASEFAFAYYGCTLLANALNLPWATRPLGSARVRRRYWLLIALTQQCLLIAVLGLVLAAHAQSITIVALLGLFLTLVLFDSLAAVSFALGSGAPGEPRMLHAGRWVASLPVVVALTVAGALGLFGLLGVLGQAEGYSQAVWLRAGVAAGVYLALAPLILTTPQIVRTAGTPEADEPTHADVPANIEADAKAATVAPDETRAVEVAEPHARRASKHASPRLGRGAGIAEMGRAYGWVHFPLVALLAVGLVGYEVALAQPEIAPDFASGRAPLIVGGLGALFTLPALLRRGPRRGRLLGLLGVLVGALAITALLTPWPGLPASLATQGADALGIALPPASLLMALSILGEIVILLAVAAVAYSLGAVSLPVGLVGAVAEAQDHILLGQLWLRHAPADAPARAQRDILNAIEAFETATRLDERNATAWSTFAHACYRMGIAMGDAGDAAGALEQLQLALAAYTQGELLDPLDAEMLCNHAETLREVGRLTQAQAQELGQQIRERFDILARRHEASTAVDGSELYLGNAAARRLHADAVRRLGALNQTLTNIAQDYRLADALCARALTLLDDPVEPGAAKKVRHTRRPDEIAAAHIRERTRQYALLTRGRVLFDWAQAHVAVPGQDDEPSDAADLEARALAAVDAALAIGLNMQALNIKGILLQRQGNPRAAAACFQQAFEVSGQSNPVIAHNLGNAWEDAGEWERAEAAYDLALKLRPAYPEARAGRERMRSRRGPPPPPRAQHGTGNDSPNDSPKDREPHGGPA